MARAQAHTLEAVAAALLLLASVVFALQVTAVTPLTASTSSEHVENQQQAMAEGLLAATAENGTLAEAVRYWNASGNNFHAADRGSAYTLGGPPNAFGEALNETFIDRGVATDVTVHYLTPGGERRSVEMVNLGVPSDNAISARRAVTLYDDDHLLFANGTRSVGLANDTYFADDADHDGPYYTTVVVEVVTWRM